VNVHKLTVFLKLEDIIEGVKYVRMKLTKKRAFYKFSRKVPRHKKLRLKKNMSRKKRISGHPRQNAVLRYF
jgi:hypothetical protein